MSEQIALLMMVMWVTAAVGLVGFNFRILLPVLASNTLSVGAATFGALYATFGCGALVGALFTAGTSVKSSDVFLVGIGMLSAGLLVIAPLHAVWVIAVMLFVVGLAFTMWSSASQTMMLAVPDRIRGRVISLWIFVWGALTPLGSLLAGWQAEVGGTFPAFSVTGGVGLLATGIAVMRMRGGLDSETVTSGSKS
jgi:MFS family permease